MSEQRIIDIKNLTVSFSTYNGTLQAVRGIDLYLKQGEVLAIVGESGCGKTVTAKAVMRLLPTPQAVISSDSEIIFAGKNLLSFTESEMAKFRGKEISMIFQDPMTSLNPTMKIGEQIAESLMIHQNQSRQQANSQALAMLELVKIPNARRRLRQYPFEFSGGMRQRVMIAIALACKPKVLIADEPTTALDVTIQAQIMNLIKDLQQKLNQGIVLITHDLGVVASVADRVLVMYAGKIMEEGTVDEIFYRPKHPYTFALLKSIPKLNTNNQEKLYSLAGTPPELINPPLGCPFAARCEFGMKVCRVKYPASINFTDSHQGYCWLYHEKADRTGLPVQFLQGVESSAQ